MSDDELELGFIVGAHGIGGAVRVRLHHSESEGLGDIKQVRLIRGADRGESMDRRFDVERVALQPGKPIVRLWLVGSRSREQADALRGATVWVPKAQLPALADDEFYLADLIGVPVMQGDVPLGHVEAITSNNMQDLLEIVFSDRGRTRRWLLPVMPEFLTEIVDGPDPHLEVDMPEGMLPAVLERALGREVEGD